MLQPYRSACALLCGVKYYFFARYLRAHAAVRRGLQLLRGHDRQAGQELQQVVGAKELAPRVLELRALACVGAIVEAKHAAHFLRMSVELTQRVLRCCEEQKSPGLGAKRSDTHEPLRF